MKKIIAIALLIATVFLITACAAHQSTEENDGLNPFGFDRFITYSVGLQDKVYVDRVTGVCYLFVQGAYQKSGGLIVMVDANGKPVIYKEAIKNAAD